MRRISPALLVSVAALVLALTGSAIAGGYIITSTHQIKPSVKRALKGNRGPQGHQGAQGVQGPPGPVVVNRLTRVDASGVIAAGAVSHITASCPAGMGAVSGVWSIVSDSGVPFYESTSGSDWTVGVDNYYSSFAADVTATVFCAPAGQAVAARSTTRAAQSHYAARDAAKLAADRR